MDLLTLAAACSHLVNPSMTLRVIEVESAGHPYAIHDNSTRQSYQLVTLPEAVNAASSLVRAGHNIDVGLMQINYATWLHSGAISLTEAFTPCTNVWLGTTILSADYRAVLPRARNTSDALYRTLSRYNSGTDGGSIRYAIRVLHGATGAVHQGARSDAQWVRVQGALSNVEGSQ